MIKTLYEKFSALYSDILTSNPTLASEHALAQEQEVYEKSNKVTYRTVSTLLLDSFFSAQRSITGNHSICSSSE